MISIHKAGEADMPWILELERENFAPPWTHGSLLSEIFNSNTFFAIARVDGRNLGFIILRQTVDTGELLQIAVEKSARRQGVATALLKAALQFAKAGQITSAFLEVREGNEAARAFYEKQNFRTMRVRKDYYMAPVEDAVEMAKGL